MLAHGDLGADPVLLSDELDDQALDLQLLEGLADRGAADVEMLGEPDLGQCGPGRVVAAEDQIADPSEEATVALP